MLMVNMNCGSMELETTQDNSHGGNDGGNGGIGSGDGDGGLSEISCGDIDGDRGGTSKNGPMKSEPSCLVANKTGGMLDDNHGVAPFLIKLYLMVDDEATNSIISWGSSRTTFVISDEPRFISEILPCYFKTSRFDSFISQLNNYGFKKERSRLEFEHEHFQEGKQHGIKRKMQRSNAINTPCVPINELNATFAKVRQEQKQISNKMRRFKYDIEQTLSGGQTIIENMIDKLLSTFTETIRRKRTFLHIDQKINFVKDSESISDHFERSVSDVDCLMTLSDLKEKVIAGRGGEGGRHGGDGDGDACGIPKFLHKLYNMVEKEEIDDLISWNHTCDSFIIWDINKFATHVLPMYFKHANFSSFNSQLNIYGFKKVSWEKHEYANEWFQGGRYDLLTNVTRRNKNIIQLKASTITCSPTKVETFNNRLKTIQHDQENKIIGISNYEEQVKSSVHEFMETVINMAIVVDKMREKITEKLKNVKKAKLEYEKNIIGNERGVEQEVNELETASRENNNSEAQSVTQELWIDPQVLNKIMTEDPWFE